jgi:RNA polymerase sigma factor (sigma-70 family)
MRNFVRENAGGTLIRQLERLYRRGTTIGLSEGELLERFVQTRDESAFEALLVRHGPMVLSVCRRYLRDSHDIDDAFQATFLILVRKAGALRRRDLLGNWLYGVAYKVASRARSMAARRVALTPHGEDMIDSPNAHDASCDSSDAAENLEASRWLHEEIRRLPERYRTPLLLCYFEGLTHDEAARRTGCPLGTVKGRLARARDLLERRLTTRGVALSAGALATLLSASEVRAAVPASLEVATLKAARIVAGAAAGALLDTTAVSLPALSLVDGVLHAMTLSQLRTVGLSLLVVGTMTAGIVGAAGSLPLHAKTSTAPGQTGLAPVDRSDGGEGSTGKRTDGESSAQSPTQAIADGAVTKSASRRQSAPTGRIVDSPRGDDDRAKPPGTFSGIARNLLVDDEGVEFDVEFRKRLDIARLAAGLAAGSQRRLNEAINKRLNEPMTLSFSEPTPLTEVVKYIKSASKTNDQSPLPIYVDPLGLQESLASSDANVTLDLDGVPLKASLRLLLRQLGLAYCVRDGVLIISSVERIREELTEAALEDMNATSDQSKGSSSTRSRNLGEGSSQASGK